MTKSHTPAPDDLTFSCLDSTEAEDNDSPAASTAEVVAPFVKTGSRDCALIGSLVAALEIAMNSGNQALHRETIAEIRTKLASISQAIADIAKEIRERW